MPVENLKCPECGGKMISRTNRETRQQFWGCADYPECRGTRDTDGRSRDERREQPREYKRRWDR